MHGAYSTTVRQRFYDLRTSHGRQPATAMKALTDYFDAENFSAPMQIILDANIRPQIITKVLDFRMDQSATRACITRRRIAASSRKKLHSFQQRSQAQSGESL